MDEHPESQGEALPGDVPGYHDWRSWYRHKALDWLKANTDRDYESGGVDNCLHDLGKDASCRAAAVALFWIVYLDDRSPYAWKKQILSELMRSWPGGKSTVRMRCNIKRS